MKCIISRIYLLCPRKVADAMNVEFPIYDCLIRQFLSLMHSQ